MLALAYTPDLAGTYDQLQDIWALSPRGMAEVHIASALSSLYYAWVQSESVTWDTLLELCHESYPCWVSIKISKGS